MRKEVVMCYICNKSGGHESSCPFYKGVAQCSECGAQLPKGASVFKIKDEIVCKECIQMMDAIDVLFILNIKEEELK